MSTVTGRVESGTRPRSVDWGRVAMVPVSALLGALAIARLVTLLSNGPSSVANRSGTALTATLTAAFYGLIVWAYLRRGPASATSSVLLALIAAPVATFLPFVLPYLGTGGATGPRVLVGDLLLVGGLAFSVWSIRHLDRSLSVVPQARVLVDRCPYAVVRHPLYLGELVAMLGLALVLGGPGPLLCWAALVALQCYRALQEESLLGDALPGYEAYRARTARVVPGLL